MLLIGNDIITEALVDILIIQWQEQQVLEVMLNSCANNSLWNLVKTTETAFISGVGRGDDSPNVLSTLLSRLH